MARVEDLPLFPLGMVALPHELVPLHVFEERFKALAAVCLEHEREFGIVWSTDEGLKQMGCACEITEVLERADDGRLNILTHGTRPFRVLEERDDLPYPAAAVEFPPDKEEEPDADIARDAHTVYAEL